jgi:energy-coupling factor transporter ATP-binding protein EcfA2
MIPKTLTKIKLMNWMYFENVTIDIEGNTLITGTNASGKSTIIDALQYLLVGGRQKSRFNTAADESGRRTLEGYVRGTVNTDVKTHLRPGDVTSHIAIEITENGVSDIFGVVIDVAKTNLSEKFYFIKSTAIDDSLFIDERHDGKFIRNQQQFRQYLKDLGKQYEFFASITQYRMKQQSFFGILSEKYATLLPKAIGFKSISKVDSFVNDFLLDDTKVDITGLRENMNQLEQLRHSIEKEQCKLESLDEIASLSKHYRAHEKEIRINEIAQTRFNIMKFQDDHSNYEKRIAANADKIRQTEIESNAVKREVRAIEDTISAIKHDMSENETYRTLDTHIRLRNELNEQYEENERHFAKLKEIMKSEKNIIRTVRNEDDRLFSDIARHLSEDSFDTQSLRTHLVSYQNEVKDLVQSNTTALNVLSASIDHLTDEISNKEAEIENLRKGIKPYPKGVADMKAILAQRLLEINKTSVDVHPLCELTEVKDETWRHALEGYLDAHRFDLFVHPQHLKNAIDIFHEECHNKGISGVGIIDTSKFTDDIDPEAGSLSSIIETKTRHAAIFLHGLLNHVKMVGRLNDIFGHPAAITSSCIVYQDGVLKSIDRSVYASPFIGRASDEIQIKMRTQELKRLNDTLDENRSRARRCRIILDVVQRSQVGTLLNRDVPYLGSIDNKTRLASEIKACDSAIKDLRENEDLIYLTGKLSLEEDALDQKRSVQIGLERRMGALTNESETLNAQSLDVSDKLGKLQQESDLQAVKPADEGRLKERIGYFSKNHDRNYDEILLAIQRSTQQREGNKRELEGKIISRMSEFNFRYSFESEATIGSIDAYLDQKRIIESDNLIKYNDQLEDLQHKTSDIFKQHFIQAIRDKILTAKEQIDHLNRLLRDKHFGEYTYRIVAQASKDPEMKDYHRVIMDDPDALEQTLFDDVSTSKNRDVLKSMFNKVLKSEDDARNAEILDYRKYMDIDIEIKTKTKTTYLSRVKHTQSGGESQVPYYIIAAASFQQLMMRNRSQSTPLCIVLFDEAFNNMDSQRVSQMMAYYNELDIQIFLSLTGEKIDSIFQHVDTALVVIRDDERAEINRFTGDDHV